MILVLHPPVTSVYDYKSLAHFIYIWRAAEEGESWSSAGYAPCAPIHKKATSNRQWDASSTVLDDELDRSTAAIIGECMDALGHADRALIMYGNCGVRSTWVEAMEPARAQARYEGALQALALSARKGGVDV